jgi:hypothetical protein
LNAVGSEEPGVDWTTVVVVVDFVLPPATASAIAPPATAPATIGRKRLMRFMVSFSWSNSRYAEYHSTPL